MPLNAEMLQFLTFTLPLLLQFFKKQTSSDPFFWSSQRIIVKKFIEGCNNSHTNHGH